MAQRVRFLASVAALWAAALVGSAQQLEGDASSRLAEVAAAAQDASASGLEPDLVEDAFGLIDGYRSAGAVGAELRQYADMHLWLTYMVVRKHLAANDWRSAFRACERGRRYYEEASGTSRIMLDAAEGDALLGAGLGQEAWRFFSNADRFADESFEEARALYEAGRGPVEVEQAINVVAYVNLYLSYISLLESQDQDQAALKQVARLAERFEQLREWTGRPLGRNGQSYWHIQLSECGIRSKHVGDPRYPGAADEVRQALGRILAVADLDPADRDARQAELDEADEFWVATGLAYIDLTLGNSTDVESLLERALDRHQPSLLEAAYVEALRTRAARLQGTNLAAAHTNLDQTIDALLVSWRSLGRRTGGVSYLAYERERFVLLERALAEIDLGRPEDALLGLLELDRIGVLADGLDVRAPALPELRERLLGPEGAALMFFRGVDQSLVFVLDRESLTTAEIRIDDQLLDEVRDWRARLDWDASDPSATADAQEQGRRIAESLLTEELWQRIGRARRLVVTGSEMLRGLPFECLPGSTGQALGLTHALSSGPSISAALELARRDRADERQGRGYFLIGAPELGREDLEAYPQLPALSVDGEWGAGWKVGPLARRVGLDATASAFKSEELGSSFVLEVLAHGVRIPNVGRSAALLLSPMAAGASGVLSAEAIESTRLPPLCILNVCRSADVAPRLGDEGSNHLGGAMLLAGARCVLLSRSDLFLEPAKVFTRELRRALSRGLPADEAARLGRIAVAAVPAWEHPGVWGPISVYGFGATRVPGEGVQRGVAAAIPVAASSGLDRRWLLLFLLLPLGWLLRRGRYRARSVAARPGR